MGQIAAPAWNSYRRGNRAVMGIPGRVAGISGTGAERVPTRTRRRPAFGVQPRQFRRAPPPKSDSNLKRRVGAAFRRRRSMCAVRHIALAGLACPMRACGLSVEFKNYYSAIPQI